MVAKARWTSRQRGSPVGGRLLAGHGEGDPEGRWIGGEPGADLGFDDVELVDLLLQLVGQAAEIGCRQPEGVGVARQHREQIAATVPGTYPPPDQPS